MVFAYVALYENQRLFIKMKVLEYGCTKNNGAIESMNKK